jgi:septum formation protein
VAGGGDLGGAEARLTLASTSPQRRAILEQLRIPFEVVTPDFVEDDEALVTNRYKVLDVVLEHALGKARSVHVSGAVTLAVDTTVVLDGQVFAKPGNRIDAERMLRELSARTHTVVSGVCLLGGDEEVLTHETTDVTFRLLSHEIVDAYLDSGEWEGRAGAYAIQGLGGRLVERIEGDYLNVVGLPGALLVSLLQAHAPNLLQTRR